MWAYSYVIYRRRAFECVPEVVFILFLREGKNIPLQNFYKVFRLKTVIEIWDNGTLLHRQWDALWPCPWSPLPVLGVEDVWDHSPHRQPWVPLSTTQATALGSISSLRLHPRRILPADFTWEPRVGRDDNQQSISPANRPTWEHLALGRTTRSFHLALRSEGVERVSFSYSKNSDSSLFPQSVIFISVYFGCRDHAQLYHLLLSILMQSNSLNQNHQNWFQISVHTCQHLSWQWAYSEGVYPRWLGWMFPVYFKLCLSGCLVGQQMLFLTFKNGSAKCLKTCYVACLNTTKSLKVRQGLIHTKCVFMQISKYQKMVGASYIPELKTDIFILLYLVLFTSSVKKKNKKVGFEWFSWFCSEFTHLHSSTNADGTLNKYCEAQPVMSNSQPHNSYEPVFF